METKLLVSFLKSQHLKAKFTDRLKIVYRPYICPFDELLEMVDHQDKVFDIGCGSGQFAMLLAEFSKPSQIHGVEIAQHLVNNANELFKKYPEIDFNFNIYDGVTLPDAFSEATKIFMIDVLHHIPKHSQHAFLVHVYKRMQKGASLIIKDINAGSPFVYFNKIHDLVFAGEIGNEFSKTKLANTLQSLGFTIESSSTKTMYVYPHYTIVAKK